MAVRKSHFDGRKSQHGFTLIEMSIVLAIIGLIVGGILKGQEVVNNARLKTQVAQIDAVKSAVFTFQDQFNFLPGDYAGASNTFNIAAGNGDGNGAIAAAAALSITDNLTENATEAVLAWAQLDAANLLSGIQLPQGTLLSAVTNATLLNYPGKLNNTFLWLATWSSTPPGGVANTGVMVRLQAVSTGGVTAAQPYAVREADAANLDRKYDDGLPQTGSILVQSASSTTSCATAAGVYTLGNGTPTNTYCNLMFVVQ